MPTAKNEAAVLAHNDPEANNPNDILATFEAAVKRNDLHAVFDAANITPKEATRLLRQYFPSLDKTVISKCSRPDKYGCVLHPQGYEVLRGIMRVEPVQEGAATEVSPSARKSHSRSDHRYTYRVAGRLPDDKYLRLQRYIRMEGYETTQDWVTAQVDAFIEKMEEKYG